MAEEEARSDNSNDPSGYYWRVLVYDHNKKTWRKPTSAEARKMAAEDHALFTYGRGEGLTGGVATRSVEENWTQSHISRLMIGEPIMAINALARVDPNFQKVSMAKKVIEQDNVDFIGTAGPGQAIATASIKQRNSVKRGGRT